MSDTDDEFREAAPLNYWALAGLVVSVAVAVVALFTPPLLAGLPVFIAFLILAGIELLAALGVLYFVRNLHDREE